MTRATLNLRGWEQEPALHNTELCVDIQQILLKPRQEVEDGDSCPQSLDEVR